MWNTAAEPAVRGQLLIGLAGVSLSGPQTDFFPAESVVQWDRCLLEQNLGETAAGGFHVSEAALHRVWLGPNAGSQSRFTPERFLRWFQENSEK